MATLLSRIDADIASAPNAAIRAEHTARKAAYLARIGEFTGASSCLESIRLTYGRGTDPRVSITVMIAEGVLGFFQSLTSNYRDRLMRANALSSAGGYKDLERLSAAWLAHADFSGGAYAKMEGHIQRCFSSPDGPRDEATMRAFITLADANLYVGRYSAASALYNRGRQLAVAFGDEATISAVIYNRAALKIARDRIASALGLEDSEAAEFQTVEVASAASFHHGAGHRSLGQLIDVLKARELKSRGQFEEAALILQRLVDEDVRTSYVNDIQVVQAELADCLLHSGQMAAAIELMEGIAFDDTSSLDPDDRLILVSYQLSFAKRQSPNSPLADLVTRRESAIRDYLEEVKELESVLDRIAIDGVSVS